MRSDKTPTRWTQTRCKYGDPTCPCQDGDGCHYEGPNPMKPPVHTKSEKKDA